MRPQQVDVTRPPDAIPARAASLEAILGAEATAGVPERLRMAVLRIDCGWSVAELDASNVHMSSFAALLGYANPTESAQPARR